MSSPSGNSPVRVSGRDIVLHCSLTESRQEIEGRIPCGNAVDDKRNLSGA